MVSKSIVALAACVAMCVAQPVEKMPVLKDQPAEVLFRESQATVLECVTENGDKDVKYSWQKDGKEFKWQEHNIAQRKDEGSLVFLKPEAKDEGQYRCFAESAAGVATSHIISFRRTYMVVPTTFKTVEKKPVEGSWLKLECSIPEGYPKPTIVWRKQLGEDESIADSILARRITQSPEGDLYFTSVEKEDVSESYKYVCAAKSPAIDGDVPLVGYTIKSLEKNTNQKNGELVPMYVSNDMIAKAGDVTMIYCMYGGVPMAYPNWFKDGKDVNGKPSDRITRHNRTSGKRLFIKETLLEDQGTFTCDVNNEVGKPQKHSVKLTVVSGPRFTKKPEKQVIAKQGQDFVIPCEVSALPAAPVSWTFNAKPISGSRVVASPSGLTIKGIQKSDKGYYGCQAHNEHGDAYAETLVIVA
uniref:Hemolin n=1 Tax=Manduca sexta TaxID=7130 RepID=HEMO_MANSE|nr:RecName: Full=Hemolin; AltName: Full=Hemocyte aggregation inhibitor; AltName: Full=Protein P4; Flags: Precursor [Manduca sexta]AAA20148.1 hemolin [Manduca sexta]